MTWNGIREAAAADGHDVDHTKESRIGIGLSQFLTNRF